MRNKIPVELKGLGGAIILALLLCVTASIVVYYTALQETLLNPLGKIILVLSVFTGGCYVSKAYGNKGLVRGAAFGIMFFILMFITTLIYNPSHIYFKGFAYTLTVCIVSGGIGGILGIGLSEER
ncbi:MAG: TIGR04086 family membrane protein [Syntrophomonas sp.]|nr:TIGR04086 family membrane protein [Syntrophomonas sp.]